MSSTSPTKTIFFVLTFTVFVGTLYSVLYNTYLDTSDPFVAHLPHPLHDTHYFASKRNFLNVYFTKKAWGWVTLSFFFLFFTSPSVHRKKQRIYQYLIECAVWLAFTTWFFGPPVIERVVVNTGGECILPLPSGDLLTVPGQLCYSRSTVSPATHPSLFAASLVLPDASWQGLPRLRRGHDVSGHVFLLTMASLFLADQLKYTLRPSPSTTSRNDSKPLVSSLLHRLAVLLSAAMVIVSIFSVYTTSVYFHTPSEKLTGYLLGVLGFGFSQIFAW